METGNKEDLAAHTDEQKAEFKRLWMIRRRKMKKTPLFSLLY